MLSLRGDIFPGQALQRRVPGPSLSQPSKSQLEPGLSPDLLTTWPGLLRLRCARRGLCTQRGSRRRAVTESTGVPETKCFMSINSLNPCDRSLSGYHCSQFTDEDTKVDRGCLSRGPQTWVWKARSQSWRKQRRGALGQLGPEHREEPPLPGRTSGILPGLACSYGAAKRPLETP